MSSFKDDFDPYYTWLGIRPEEQPADHYRLIGLKQFENNADVIANATDRQMQFLRTLQVGKRSALSQKLLNEVSAAGGCLLDPERRVAYDKELKAKEIAKAKTITTSARPIPKAAPLAASPQPIPFVLPLPEPDLFSLPLPLQTYVPPGSAAQRALSQPASILPLILGGAAGGIVLLLVVVIVAGSMFSRGKTVANKPDQGQKSGVKGNGSAGIVPVEKPGGTPIPPEKTEKMTSIDSVKLISTPAAVAKAKANDWSYGVGAFDQNSNQVNLFSPLKHWTGDAWQVSKQRPDEKSGWIYLDAAGGSAGYKHKDSAIRRWTAPQAGKLSIRGELKHFHMEKKGDGIRGRMVSSRKGLLGEWQQIFSSAKTNVDGIEVQAGDQIDFVVDCWNDWFCDTFSWEVDLRLTDSQGKELGTWNSAADFHGPQPGQSMATSGGAGSPAASLAKLPRLPRDPNWKPPGDKGQTKFSTFLGTYSHWDRRDRPYPVVNLQLPANNLWTKDIQQKLQGKIPFEEISYLGRAMAYIPIEGVYVVDTHRAASFDINSQRVSGRGEVKLSAGYQTVSLDVSSHGGPFIGECGLSMYNKATGEEVQFFNYWEDIQKFLASPISGQAVTEVSGWQPMEVNDLRGPVYWWNFDELFKDSAGDPEGRILMRFWDWQPGEPKFVPGKVGNGVRFSQPRHHADTDRYADFPHLSIVFWLRVLEEQGINPRIASPWVDLNYEKAAGIRVLGSVVDPKRPELGKWYHYGVTINQETKQAVIYREGIQVASGNLGNYESKGAVRWWAFGHNQDGQNHNDTLRGELDEVRIYDRVLSQDEIRQLLAIDLARSSNAPVTPPAVAGPSPATDGQAAFRSVLGSYRYSNDPAKTYPYVNLQVPHKNLWTPEIAEKVRGKMPYEEISYIGTTKIAVPADGTYLWDAEKPGRLQIDGKVVSEWDTPKGEIKLTRGVHDLVFEIGSHGGNWMRDTNLALRNKETGEEVPFFNTWQDIQKFLATPISGQPVTEVSGWQPNSQNELKNGKALLASAGVKRPDVPSPPNIPAIPPKPAIPDPAAVAAARKEVAAIFKDDLKVAKTPKARQELANKMLGIAKATGDPTEKYATLEEVRKLAEEIKDAALAALVLDAEEADFGIDALSEKVHLLEKLSGGTMTPVQRNELLSVAMGFGDAALAAGKTQALPALTAVIRTLAGKGVTPDRKTEALDFVESLSQRQQDAESLRRAEQKLAKSPDDPEANLIMGLYYCFTVKDDLKGLPLLVKGKDPNFTLAGRCRLSVTSTSTLCTLEGAHAWADAVPAAPAEYKWRVQKRALEYYQWMLVNSKGPDNAAAQKRHDQLLTDIVSTLKQSELPRSTPGLVGRVQVDGKDAGIVVTSRPPGELREERLAAILAQAKGRRARLVLSATFHCETPGEFRVYHVGREGGPPQVISLDGKPFSSAGGANGSGGEQRGNVGAGDHVLQWICEFDLSTRPRLDLSFGPTPEDQNRLEVFASQRQLFEAWKLSTKMDITVSEY